MDGRGRRGLRLGPRICRAPRWGASALCPSCALGRPAPVSQKAPPVSQNDPGLSVHRPFLSRPPAWHRASRPAQTGADPGLVGARRSSANAAGPNRRMVHPIASWPCAAWPISTLALPRGRLHAPGVTTSSGDYWACRGALIRLLCDFVDGFDPHADDRPRTALSPANRYRGARPISHDVAPSVRSVRICHACVPTERGGVVGVGDRQAESGGGTRSSG